MYSSTICSSVELVTDGSPIGTAVYVFLYPQAGTSSSNNFSYLTCLGCFHPILSIRSAHAGATSHWPRVYSASGFLPICVRPYLPLSFLLSELPLIQLLHRVDCSISNLSVHFLLSFLPIRDPSYILYRSHCSRTLIDFAAAVSLTLLYFAVANFNCSSCTCFSLSLLKLTNYLHRCCKPVT